MDTQNLFLIQTHFDLIKTMFGFTSSFWVFSCHYFFLCFGFINRFFFRFQEDGNCSSNHSNSNCVASQQEEDNQVDSKFSQVSKIDDYEEKESVGFDFKFEFQNSKEFNDNHRETEDSVFVERGSSASTSKYQFISARDFRGFVEEFESTSFSVQELFVGSNENFTESCEIPVTGVSDMKDFHDLNLENTVESVEISGRDEELEKFDEVGLIQNEILVETDLQQGSITTNKFDFMNYETLAEDSIENGLGDEAFTTLEAIEEETIGNESDFNEFSISTYEFDLKNDEILGEKNIGNELGVEDIAAVNGVNEEFIEKILLLGEDSQDEYIELEPHKCDFDAKKMEKFDDFEIFEEPELESSMESDSEDENELDLSYDHEDLIEQLKMELKNAKASRGLPTILEESESMKIVEDLKPLMIDKTIEYKDRINEIRKVYKTYEDKMRKLDILSCQTLHAYSIRIIKDPIHKKHSNSSQNIWAPHKQRQPKADPTLKFIEQLHKDLEMVYVGHVCLSWEILNWQYTKARELRDHDLDGLYRCNQVSGQFQQFQVLVRRFVEDERFQGPRIESYVKNRCIHRNLLQVPVIKDDCLKDKNERRDEEDVISCEVLIENIEESMRVFWEFIRADKNVTNVTSKGLQVDLQDPADSELLMNIQTTLHKKEKKLKDILRSGNCIVKKFRKHHEDGSSRVLLLAQVEMRLVSRVLSMSTLTADQLVWCHKKLSKINFINRGVLVEPSFLLFP